MNERRPFGGIGDPSASGIVLVHGTRMAGAYWHAQRVALSDSYYVVAPDLPGHGARRTTPFTHAAALATIRTAIAACVGGTAIVVGHSLGGYLVMDLAAASPELCRALVLVGCSAVAQGPKTWPYRAVSRMLPLFPESALTRWNDRLLRRLYPAELVEHQIAAGYGFGAVATSWRTVLGRDHAPALHAFPRPVLVVNGARDRFFRSDEQYFVRSCTHGRLEVIANAGHLCNLDCPNEFTETLRTFADSIA